MWNQVYDPLNSIWISALIASIPIIVFIILLLFKMKGYIAALISILAAAINHWIHTNFSSLKIILVGNP
ncbi:hypothetical protein [Bacillus sp. Au-Bac7]|uniref:hypothetical protein n=1 Tax=Bacillus sp. Au-Bac7 TaxID=2906458 RepID=UPI001E445E3B|nr:hypothetical protein [Bacillus sp. Au-Bac7]MCE4052194.1 hypothetical protein [Bacillus sp. Au-Bac7]